MTHGQNSVKAGIDTFGQEYGQNQNQQTTQENGLSLIDVIYGCSERDRYPLYLLANYWRDNLLSEDEYTWQILHRK